MIERNAALLARQVRPGGQVTSSNLCAFIYDICLMKLITTDKWDQHVRQHRMTYASKKTEEMTKNYHICAERVS
jgi:hypothetical protein